MKKLILIFTLLLSAFAFAQKPKVDYQRFAKKTTAEIALIDVSDASVTYIVENTETGFFEVNRGSGWVNLFPSGGGGSTDAATTSEINTGTNNTKMVTPLGLAGSNYVDKTKATVFTGRVELPWNTYLTNPLLDEGEANGVLVKDNYGQIRYSYGIGSAFNKNFASTAEINTGASAISPISPATLEASKYNKTALSQFTNDVPFLTSSSLSNYVTLNSSQYITGHKTFRSNISFENNQWLAMGPSNNYEVFANGTELNEQFRYGINRRMDFKGGGQFNIFLKSESDVLTQRFNFNPNNGKLRLHAYGTGVNTGTATYGAAFDANGNLIEVALGGGGSSGHTIQDNGTSKTARPNLNFKNFIVDDNAENDSTDITAVVAGSPLVYDYVATGGETTVNTGVSIASNYHKEVHLGVITLRPTTDYTLTYGNPTILNLTQPLEAGEQIRIVYNSSSAPGAVDLSNYVDKTTAQTITGVKTFTDKINLFGDGHLASTGGMELDGDNGIMYIGDINNQDLTLRVNGFGGRAQLEFSDGFINIKGDDYIDFITPRVQFSNYGDGIVTGIATYAAAFDENGKIIEVPLSGGSGDMLKSENLSGLANYTTARSNLGLVIGTDVLAPNGSAAALTGTATNLTAGNIETTAISSKTAKTTLAGTEEVLINDAGTLKKTTAQAIADLGGGGSNIPFWSKGFVFSGFAGRYYYSKGDKDGGNASVFISTSADNLPTIFNVTEPVSGFTIGKSTTITNIRLDYSTLFAETYKCYLVVKRFPSGVETNSTLWTSDDIITTASSIGSQNKTGLSISLQAGDRLFVVTTRTATTEGATTGIALTLSMYE